MSAVEKNSWPEAEGDAIQSSEAEAAKPKAERPALVAPPPRPVPSPAKPPAKPAAAKAAVAKAAAKPAAAAPPPTSPEPMFDPAAYRNQPIAPPSEPMQYRAIGLVRGTYAPTEADQINRGNLTTEDGLMVDSVLLGRVTSLVKKHLDLAASHLWVVYPRTRREVESEEDQDLHFQIVGVWEPETLGLPGESPRTDAAPEDEATPATTAPPAPTASYPIVQDNVFSIRGEVLKYDPDEGLITVKIVQGIKRTPEGAKSFKLTLKGQIEGRTVGYFWDFQARRDARVLVVESASVVGIVPPKKRPKGGGKRPGFKRPGGSRSAAPRKATGAPRPKKVIADKVIADQGRSEQEAAE